MFSFSIIGERLKNCYLDSGERLKALNATLLLEDGFILTGKVFAGEGEVSGEVVFFTGMSGYQEVITDPSCSGQILSFTYPHIGNYGCNPSDDEALSPGVKAVLIKHYCKSPHSRYSQENLGSYLERHGVIGIEGIDTRTLTLHLRRAGTMRGIISTTTSNPGELRDKLVHMQEAGTVKTEDVSTATLYRWDNDGNRQRPYEPENAGSDRHVLVIDLGLKFSILKTLAGMGCSVTVAPYNISTDDIKAINPSGIILSSGPGDPSMPDAPVLTIRQITGRYPVMGIGLGHQLLGKTLGINTFKLPFGHRGDNHPVRELETGRVLITCQNHGFNLSADTPMPEGTRVTHINLTDNTVEGIDNKNLGFFSVQFHPETGQGSPDSTNLFEKFTEML